MAQQVLLVTGGSRGIGAATALLAAERGYAVGVNYRRDAEAAAAIVQRITAAGGRAVALQADVADEAEVVALFARLDATLGPVTALVNNAGILETQMRVDALDAARIGRILATNVTGTLLCCREAVRRMSTRHGGGGGAIVNVSSVSALRPRGLTAYSTSKGAVIALTRAMAVDHGGQGVRVNCVAPGPIYTPMMQDAGMTPAQRERRRQASLLGIEATGWDVGHAVRFLLSDAARYITGQTLVVDGGGTLMGPSRDAG